MRLVQRSAFFPALSTLLALAAGAQAKPTGMGLACPNCHEGHNGPRVTATFSSPKVNPGQSVTITVTATHPTATVGGFLVDSMGAGEMKITDTVGTHWFTPDATPPMTAMPVKTQATHSAPRPYMNGQVQFSVDWVAPNTVGPASLTVWSNAANGNGKAEDDSATEFTAAIGVGCDGFWYYVDGDADGAGDAKTGVFSCQPQAGRIMQGGDCKDDDPQVKPGVMELCNGRDDNCDGKTDEGFTQVLLVRDADGDGYGAKTGMTMIGCPPTPGFAPNFDDCDDNNPAINPAAAEQANGRDDNCNGKVDDLSATGGAGPTGGTGPGGGAGATGGTGPGTMPMPAAPTASDGAGCSLSPSPSGLATGLASLVSSVALGLALRRRRAVR